MNDITPLREKARKTDARSELPRLKPKHQRFVERVAAGDLPTDVYADIWERHNDDRTRVSVAACNLLRHEGVRAWLRAMREAGVENGNFTLQAHLSELEHIKNRALERNNFGAAVRAEELRGKAMGLYVERYQDTGTADSESLLENVGKIFGSEMKKMAMQRLGIGGKKAVTRVKTIDARPIKVVEELPDFMQ